MRSLFFLAVIFSSSLALSACDQEPKTEKNVITPVTAQKLEEIKHTAEQAQQRGVEETERALREAEGAN